MSWPQFLPWRLATSNIPCKPKEEHIPKLHHLSPFPMENVDMILSLPKTNHEPLIRSNSAPQVINFCLTHGPPTLLYIHPLLHVTGVSPAPHSPWPRPSWTLQLLPRRYPPSRHRPRPLGELRNCCDLGITIGLSSFVGVIESRYGGIFAWI